MHSVRGCGFWGPCGSKHLCRRLFTDVTDTEHPAQDAEQEKAASGTYNYSPKIKTLLFCNLPRSDFPLTLPVCPSSCAARTTAPAPPNPGFC